MRLGLKIAQIRPKVDLALGIRAGMAKKQKWLVPLSLFAPVLSGGNPPHPFLLILYFFVGGRSLAPPRKKIQREFFS